jgi:pimeloyl-ACP methyl ester carboxylesterase
MRWRGRSASLLTDPVLPSRSRSTLIALLVASLVASLAAAGLLLPTATPAALAAPAPGVRWTACHGDLGSMGLQCGSLTVPLDHADPTGLTVRLALTRRPHTGSTYRGVMLVNPGGPGATGRRLAAIGGSVPGGVGDSYDWIGFDPRGVGASSPSLHCTRGEFGDDRPDYRPTRAPLVRYWLAKSRSYAAACARTAGQRALLQHLTTLDTVLDMDDIRAALGATQLSFYGFSYGTYLGEVYATRFPQRVGRFVLDGVVDPTRVWYLSNLDQDRGFDRNIDVFFHYLAAHPKAFKLGRKAKAVRRGYYRELRRLKKHPAAHHNLGPDELSDAMLDAGYYVYDWVQLGHDYSALVRGHRGGALLARYRRENAGDDNEYAIYNAVSCSDVAWPGWARTSADARAINRTAPFATWLNTWFNAPCLFWHAPHRARLAVSGASLSSKMLLISETRDAATPYSGALRVRRLFPSASLVAGAGGTTHASSLSGVACVDDTVAAYLRSGVVPGRSSGNGPDRTCPRVPPPSPAFVGGRLTSQPTDRLPPVLRHDLLKAQLIGR